MVLSPPVIHTQYTPYKRILNYYSEMTPESHMPSFEYVWIRFGVRPWHIRVHQGNLRLWGNAPGWQVNGDAQLLDSDPQNMEVRKGQLRIETAPQWCFPFPFLGPHCLNITLLVRRPRNRTIDVLFPLVTSSWWCDKGARRLYFEKNARPTLLHRTDIIGLHGWGVNLPNFDVHHPVWFNMCHS